MQEALASLRSRGVYAWVRCVFAVLSLGCAFAVLVFGCRALSRCWCLVALRFAVFGCVAFRGAFAGARCASRCVLALRLRAND